MVAGFNYKVGLFFNRFYINLPALAVLQIIKKMLIILGDILFLEQTIKIQDSPGKNDM